MSNDLSMVRCMFPNRTEPLAVTSKKVHRSHPPQPSPGSCVFRRDVKARQARAERRVVRQSRPPREKDCKASLSQNFSGFGRAESDSPRFPSISTSGNTGRAGVRQQCGQCSPILTSHGRKMPCIETVLRFLSPPPPKFRSTPARSSERSGILPTQQSKTTRNFLEHHGGKMCLVSSSGVTETSLRTNEPLAFLCPES